MANNKKKIGGPFRIEAIIPVTILCFGIFFYFKYFFDSHMKKAIEWVATYGNGAEVNLDSFNLSFIDMKLTIGKIQVTNKNEPHKNLVEIKNITFDLLTDAILRAKFVVPQASITGIKYQSHRKYPGKVLPVNPKSGPSFTKKLESTVLSHLENSYTNNILGDILDIAKGQDYQSKLKEMETALVSSQKLKDLDAELKVKKEQWEKRINDLPNEKEIKEFTEKIKAYKVDTSNALTIKSSLETLNGFIEKIKSDLNKIDEAQKQFGSDFTNYKNLPEKIQTWVEQDIKDLQNKLKIPSLNASEITKNIFGKLFAEKIRDVYKYMNMAREYLPAKKENIKNDLQPHERAKGINVKFPITKSYPMFWLQKAEISSTSSDSEFSGDLKGILTNVSDNPEHIKKPLELNIGGDFPKAQINGINAIVTVDHTSQVHKESFTASVGSFPVTGNAISKSNDLNFGYEKAKGKSKFSVSLQENILDINFENVFSDILYSVEAKDENVKRVANGIASGLTQLTLNGNAKGNWDNLEIGLNSNLGGKIQEAFTKQIESEVSRLKLQLQNHVNNIIGEQKEKITSEVQKIEKQFGVSLKSKEDAINSIKLKLEEEKNKLLKAEQDKLKSKVEAEGKKLLDNLKIKF